MLYREPKLLKESQQRGWCNHKSVSVLYREPKLLKVYNTFCASRERAVVSVLYREPKLLKELDEEALLAKFPSFSALP